MSVTNINHLIFLQQVLACCISLTLKEYFSVQQTG